MAVLEARGLEVTSNHRAAARACDDPDRLQAAIVRAATADTADEALDLLA